MMITISLYYDVLQCIVEISYIYIYIYVYTYIYIAQLFLLLLSRLPEDQPGETGDSTEEVRLVKKDECPNKVEFIVFSTIDKRFYTIFQGVPLVRWKGWAYHGSVWS